MNVDFIAGYVSGCAFCLLVYKLPSIRRMLTGKRH